MKGRGIERRSLAHRRKAADAIAPGSKEGVIGAEDIVSTAECSSNATAGS
jgi:hypothetical protein